jgi:NTE family protein
MSQAGVVLTGGGARGAYQVGVFKAISDQLPDLNYPFPIICGTSAGAINAVGLGCSGDIFRHSVERLEQLWTGLKTHQVYRSDYWGMARRMGHFLKAFMGGEDNDMPASMLDNSPLRTFLQSQLDLQRLKYNIDHSDIRAVCVTACGYTSGQSVSFFQARQGLQGWHLGQRVGCRTELLIDHLMASSAIPTIFPPVKINREYFGDGVVRNMAPLSPAIHLGADKILVIGVSANRVCTITRRPHMDFPKIPQIMEHLLNGAFIDVMENDIDKALLINQLLNLIPKASLEENNSNLRLIDMLVISPSEPIDDIAARHVACLPKPVRQFLGQNKANPEGGASMASYLLFEAPFLRDLIALGYRDAQSHARQIESFFAR